MISYKELPPFALSYYVFSLYFPRINFLPFYSFLNQTTGKTGQFLTVTFLLQGKDIRKHSFVLSSLFTSFTYPLLIFVNTHHNIILGEHTIWPIFTWISSPILLIILEAKLRKKLSLNGSKPKLIFLFNFFPPSFRCQLINIHHEYQLKKRVRREVKVNCA